MPIDVKDAHCTNHIMPTSNNNNDMSCYDVIIVGAGISGIGMAYWLQKKCPTLSFVVLEARQEIGGTWSLFRYPGVRSDSDMFTFGYRFQPWQNPQSLSAGDNILKYLQETTSEHGIHESIRFRHRMSSANWSDQTETWRLLVEAHNNDDDSHAVELEMECRFLSICTGYYNYSQAHRPEFAGEQDFRGVLVQPQFWPSTLDYTDQRVVVVGSGATAVTLVPAMARTGARHVTMLQRSPTYIFKLPNRNWLFVVLRVLLPSSWAYMITRWTNIFLSMFNYYLSRLFPKVMKWMIMWSAAQELPRNYPVEKHFNPYYPPWDQRVCVVPDGDLFQVISEGRASVVTDRIDRFTKDGILTQSGELVKADIIVLATGLKVQVLGGASLSINGKRTHFHDTMIYKGMMASNVPNLVFAFGYTNISWTLKVDLTANYACKLLNYMDQRGYSVVFPAKDEEQASSGESFVNLRSGYIQRAASILPKQGKRTPWRVDQNYLVDMLSMRFGSIEDGVLQFKKRAPKTL